MLQGFSTDFSEHFYQKLVHNDSRELSLMISSFSLQYTTRLFLFNDSFEVIFSPTTPFDTPKMTHGMTHYVNQHIDIWETIYVYLS